VNVIFARGQGPDILADLPAPPNVGDLVPISGPVRCRVVRVEWRCNRALGWHVRLKLRMRLRDWLFGS
jgi:hypothetical protein